PVEQLGVCRPLTVAAEVADTFHQGAVEVPQPDVVDGDAGGQRVVAGGQPARQGETAAGARRRVGRAQGRVLRAGRGQGLVGSLHGFLRRGELLFQFGAGGTRFRLQAYDRRRQLGLEPLLLRGEQDRPAFGPCRVARQLRDAVFRTAVTRLVRRDTCPQ